MSVDLEITQKTDFSRQFQIITSSGAAPTQYPTGLINGPVTLGFTTFTPLDLTGSTVKSQIRDFVGNRESLLASFTVTIDDAVNGLFTLSLSPTVTAQLKSEPSGEVGYDVHVTDPSGKVKTYISGFVTVIKGYTL